MKKTIKKLTKVFLLACIVAFTSCGGNDSDKPQEKKELSAVTKDFQQKVSKMSVPSSMANSSNVRAKQALARFNTVKNLGRSFSAYLTVPPGATSSVVSNEGIASRGAKTSGKGKTYTWGANGMTITYTINEEDDRYTFNYTIKGGVVNGKIMDGYQLKNGSKAEFKMYSRGKVASTFKFWVNGDIVKAEINTYGSNMVLESNLSNNSGNIKTYYKAKLANEYNWSSDGSGWYKNHATNKKYTWKK